MKGVKGTAKKIGDPCADCKKPITAKTASYRAKRAGLFAYCKTCINARAKAARDANPDHHRQKNRNYRSRLRAEVLTAMGGKCQCCGETTPEFLAVDHINGGGGKERRLLAHNTSGGVYRLVKKLGYPTDRYRLLCHNCNQARAWYGECPHERLQRPQPLHRRSRA